MQKDIFGEVKLTGSIRQQLEQVLMSEKVASPKELLQKWAEIQLSLPAAMTDRIIVADRTSRDVFNNK